MLRSSMKTPLNPVAEGVLKESVDRFVKIGRQTRELSAV